MNVFSHYSARKNNYIYEDVNKSNLFKNFLYQYVKLHTNFFTLYFDLTKTIRIKKHKQVNFF